MPLSRVRRELWAQEAMGNGASSAPYALCGPVQDAYLDFQICKMGMIIALSISQDRSETQIR